MVTNLKCRLWTSFPLRKIARAFARSASFFRTIDTGTPRTPGIPVAGIPTSLAVGIQSVTSCKAGRAGSGLGADVVQTGWPLCPAWPAAVSLLPVLQAECGNTIAVHQCWTGRKIIKRWINVQTDGPVQNAIYRIWYEYLVCTMQLNWMFSKRF